MAPAATIEDVARHYPTTYPKATTVSASVLHGPRDLRLETRSIEDPGVGEVQVAIKATGICGSDMSYYKKFANGDLCACMPLTLGHESSGVVVATGPDVSGLRVGDRVALEVGVPCGHCGICRKGRYNLCKQLRFRSSAKSVPHYQGTLQERINHPARWCHKLPDHVSFDVAALLEPLSVAMHAVNRAHALPGSTALVIGAGAVGLLTAAVARSSGYAQVTITDVDAGRVDYALAKGFATHGYVVPSLHLRASSSASSLSLSLSTVSSGASTPPESVGACTPSADRPLGGASPFAVQIAHAKDLAAALQARTREPAHLAAADDEAEEEDEGFDVTFECTGKEECMHTSLYATRAGGKLVMVGMGTPVQTLPLSVAHLREIDILGIFRYANTYAAGIRMLCAGTLPPLDDMVTHRFKGLAAAQGAFEVAGRTVDDGGNLVLKVVIDVS